MKRTLKKLFLCGMIIGFCVIPTENLQINAAKNNVPDYYYANYKFADDWDALLTWFTKAKAKYSLGQEFSSSEFAELAQYFDKTFPHLTKDYTSVYEKCSLLANSLAKEYSRSEMNSLMGNSCYKSLTQTINKINSSYTVKPSVSSNPSAGMAPLTVTFDARNSTDPSLETIPADNFYRYYRDENGVDTPIGEGQVLSYTFNEPGKFIVHLVVRSSNVNQGILDGERNLTINVTPKAADIVVYANTRRMFKNTPLKLGITEGERGIVFDGSLTKPRGGRIIEKHRWVITNNGTTVEDTKRKDGAPTYINKELKGSGLFKVTLMTRDNEKNTVSEDYYVYLSDPVTVIKQTPEKGTTSTTFNFDGSASYSITNRISSYVWEIFDGNGDENNGEKIVMFQGKKMEFNGNKKLRPGNYMVRLTVTDMTGSQNVDTKELYVESTTPTPQFTVTPTNKWLYPSEFTLDASNTTDIDVDNGVDSLEYTWSFSTDNVKILSTENNNEKMVVQFNEKGKHIIRMVATDQYGKFASVSKYVEVKSTLRPEIEIIPGPVTWGKTLEFKSSINQPVRDYTWDFGDGKDPINSESATETQHVYKKRGIYPVKLTVTNSDGEYNTINEKAFVGEIEYPIAAYSVSNDKGFYIQSSDTCKIENKEGNYNIESAYPIDRYAKFTINPGKSVNTKGTSNGLQYVFEKEEMVGANQAKTTNLLSTTFNQIGCHYVDLTVKDSNVGKQDKTRIWFNVKNALPKLKNVTLSFVENGNTTTSSIGVTNDANSNKTIFPCSGNSNLTVKVTAVGAEDSDGNISRLRFYYYNIDDPDRILEYKESRINVPYVYFILPRISGEYKFGVMVYDNDGGMINSDEYLASNPSVYFSSTCGEVGVPTVTLKVSSTNIQVGDTVTYTIVSKLSADNEDFEADRTFYYDFEGDGIRDLVSKKDTATHTFNETYEDGVTPRAAVEYRGKLGQTEGAKILVKNGIKPVLLTNSYGNTVIFRDMSIGVMQQRQICFETNECELGNTKFRRTHISTTDPSELTGGSETSITQNDSFVRKYDNYGDHNVSIYLKNKYGIEVQTGFVVRTSSDKNNGRIAPGVNMITIPETTINNTNPEIFLSKVMNNTLLMYINDENGGTCYVDTDIATDSDGDGKSDNDMDIQCNKMAKIKYEPDYESAIGRVYFTNNGNLTFKNFYVTFEGIILELDDEKKEIYDDITTLVNGIEDLSTENTDLKKSLDKLRKNLNNRGEVTSLVITINEQIEEGGLKMSSKQKETLDSVLSRLSNEDTVISVGMNEYEKNKREIIALLPSQGSLKSTIEGKFSDFEENLSEYGLEKRVEELESIWDIIIKESKKNKGDDSYFTPYFCNIFEHFSISTYTDRCGAAASDTILDNYKKEKATQSSTSEKSKFPLRLKIILIILVGGLLTMGGVIIFFSVKARLNTATDNEDEEG